MSAEVCLIMPFWSQSDGMNWDSNYTYLKAVVPKLSEELPDWLWVVLWPDANYGADVWKWAGDGFFNDRIVRYPWPYDTAMRSSVLGFDPMKFKTLDFKVAPTLFWMHQVEAIPFMVGGYKQSFSKRSQPLFVAQHHYIVHKSLPYPMEGMFSRLWLQMGGSLAADRVLVHSDYCNRMMLESFGEYLTSEKLNELKNKTTVCKWGLEDGDTDIPIGKGPGVPVVVYNHRFELYKDPFKTGEILSSLKSSGHDFQVWITQIEGQRAKFFPVDRAVGHHRRRTYMENIAVPAINTTNSLHETFCISILDSMALGHTIVAPNGITFPELLPKGYPFLFNSIKEQTAMLSHIIETWPKEYLIWRDVLRIHVKKNFSLKPYVKKQAKILSLEAARWEIRDPKEKTKAGMDKFFRSLKPGTYTMDSVRISIHKFTETGDQSVPSRRIVREWGKMGGKVIWGNNEVMLRWQ